MIEFVSIMLSDFSRPEGSMATALVRELDDAVYERLKRALLAITVRWKPSCERFW